MARDLPPRMLRRTRQMKSGKLWVGYYYDGREDGKRKEIPLGTDLNEAKRKWAELEQTAPPVDSTLMRHVFDRYEREVLTSKAPRTQKDNLQEFKMLRPVFGEAPIDAIRPIDIQQYLNNRSAKTRANREIALLSHVFRKARNWGYTDQENPCLGVDKNKEIGRTFYADDAVWNAIRQHADPVLRDALDLAYLTGQRPADVCKMRWDDIQNGRLIVNQNKTGRHLKINIVGELAMVIQRIRERARVEGMGSTIIAARHERQGTRLPQSLSESMRKERLKAARHHACEAALKVNDISLVQKIKAFQFRDARSKAASDIGDITAASKLLGHTKEQITKSVYRRNGESVEPVK